jgi:hypothetical protein
MYCSIMAATQRIKKMDLGFHQRGDVENRPAITSVNFGR